MEKYCRLCLCMTSEHYTEITSSKYRKQLETVLPELSVDMVRTPLLCESCSKVLETAYKFKVSALQVDSYLRIFVEANNTDLVPLSHILIIKKDLDDKHDDDILSDDFPENLCTSVKDEDHSHEMKNDDDDEEELLMPLDEDIYDEKHSVYLTQNLNSQDNKLTCDECNKIFSNLRQLNRHKLCHGKRKYKCDISGCNKSFPMRTKLVQHKKQHTELTCNTCGHILRTYRSYQNHLRRHLGLHKCETCGMNFPNSVQLKSHIVVHTGAREYICDLCGKGFGQSSTLRMHIGCVHATERPFSCEVCGRSFTLLKLKKLHMAAMHLERDRKFDCTICGKSLKFKSSLRDHMKRHSGERKHVCKICDKRFVDSSGLKKHIVIHGNDKPHECPYCFKRTNQKYNLTIHLRTCAKRKQAEQLSTNTVPVVCEQKYEVPDTQLL